jgi:hypothetical protein
MPVWGWVLIVIGIVVAVAVVAWAMSRRTRTRRLEQRFGPEYGRAVESHGDRRSAEADLREREEARDHLDIRPLPAAARARYQDQWSGVQAAFVDDPTRAVGDADRLVATVMRERGDPVDDFEQQSALVSVDHPTVVDNYRQGHDIYLRNERDEAETEDLRQAMQNYRALFDELLGDQPSTRENVSAAR